MATPECNKVFCARLWVNQIVPQYYWETAGKRCGHKANQILLGMSTAPWFNQRTHNIYCDDFYILNYSWQNNAHFWCVRNCKFSLCLFFLFLETNHNAWQYFLETKLISGVIASLNVCSSHLGLVCGASMKVCSTASAGCCKLFKPYTPWACS